MRSSVALSVAALLAGCRFAPAPTVPAPEAAPVDAFAVVAEADRLAARDLWPGFDPRTIPVAVHDGERTLLFRHPSPPDGFEPVPGREGVWTYPGRHPTVTANTRVEIGGVATATLMPAADTVPLSRRAGILVHEAFHVFQGERHPGWIANEAELFTYPVDDPDLLSLRRMETEALRRALLADDGVRAACWGRVMVGIRRERFARMSEGAAGYEVGTEWVEGLASYVEGRAIARPDSAYPSADAPAPEAIRQGAYATGAALARLLDRLSPGWRASLERDDSTPLYALLDGALGNPGSEAGACGFTPAERDRVRTAAAADVDALRTRRAGQRRDFFERPGWTVVVAAPDTPLFPQGFDPLNVQVVRTGEVLHSRWLKLGNGAGAVEVLGHAAVTEAAGAHPLFNGVRTLTITGLAAEPVSAEADGVVTLKADGISAELRGATVERSGQTVTVRLPSAR